MNILRRILLGLVVMLPLLFVAPMTADADHARGYRYHGRPHYHHYHRPYYGHGYHHGYGHHGYRGYYGYPGTYGTPRFHYHHYGPYGGAVHVGPLGIYW